MCHVWIHSIENTSWMKKKMKKNEKKKNSEKLQTNEIQV